MSLFRLREECAALAHWWLHEMREAIADLGQRWAPGKPSRSTIYLTSSSSSRLVQQWRDGTAKSIEGPRIVNSDSASEWRELLAQSVTDGAPVHLVLQRSEILIRRVWLPSGAERNLAPVVELQLERELPVARDQVQIDWRIEARNADRTKIEVVIAVLRRSSLHHLLDTVSTWKLRVLSISVDMGADRTAFNFAPRRTSRPTGRLARIDRWLAISAAVLVLAYVSVVGTQWLRERFVVGAALTAANVPAHQVGRMRTQLAKQSEPLSALLQLTQSPPIAEVLADLTGAVPRDTWLQQLEILILDSGAAPLKLTVITPAATQLVDQLESASHLEHVKLQSANTAGLGTARDRAELTADWVRPP